MLKQPQKLHDAASFTQFLHQHIVPSQLLAMEVQQISATDVILTAPVAGPNINIHHTAFAGSIYSVCTLAGWSLAHHRLCVAGINADVVMGTAEITYKAPINNIIEARISVSEDDMLMWIDKLKQKGKGAVSARVEAVEDGVVKAVLEGKLVAIVSP